MMKLSYIAINKAIASNRTTRRDEKSSGCRKHSIFGQAALPNLFIKISGIVEAETVVEEAMRKLETNNKDAKLDPQEDKYDGELGVNDIDSKLNPHGELNGKENKLDPHDDGKLEANDKNDKLDPHGEHNENNEEDDELNPRGELGANDKYQSEHRFS